MSDSTSQLNMDLEDGEIDPGSICDIELWVDQNLPLNPHFMDNENHSQSEGAEGQGEASTLKQPLTLAKDSCGQPANQDQEKGESKVKSTFVLNPSKFKSVSFQSLKRESEPPFGVGSPLANLSTALLPPLNTAQKSVAARLRGNAPAVTPQVTVPQWPPGRPDWIAIQSGGVRGGMNRGSRRGPQRPKSRGQNSARARANRRAAQFRQRATDSRAAQAFATFFNTFTGSRR